MKRILALIIVVLTVGGVVAVSHAADADSNNQLVWCGLDYSMVKMIGTADFRKPSEIFPDMLQTWNGLFMQEMLPKLEKISPSVVSDLNAVSARNGNTSTNQIIHEDGTRKEMVEASDITTNDLAKMVHGYDLKHSEGIGLVYVMDRLVKAQQTGCLYVVFFDISSRKILVVERMTNAAGGAGFRNYWFRPIKTATEKLPGLYKQAKTALAQK
ncbi:MAG TPA: hypothetical protein VGO57_16185 [Verrucomicrobiae bacterium]|jgi:hypothetical protein